jgi:hypothetical protein
VYYSYLYSRTLSLVFSSCKRCYYPTTGDFCPEGLLPDSSTSCTIVVITLQQRIFVQRVYSQVSTCMYLLLVYVDVDGVESVESVETNKVEKAIKAPSSS